MLKYVNKKIMSSLSFCFIMIRGQYPAALQRWKIDVPLLAAGLLTIFCLGFNPVKISAEKSDFQIQDGVLTAYNGSDTTVTVPDGITRIGDEAFKDAKIKKVVLPVGVKEIGEFAFDGCEELESVVLPEGVTVIGDMAFYECKKLQHIELPNSLKTIKFAVFAASGLTSVTLPPSVIKIGYEAFQECKKLESVQLPEKLEVIDVEAFDRCYALKKIIVPATVTQIGREAFANCYNLKKVVIYSDKIEKVGDYPFLFHAANRKVIFKKKVSEKYKKKFHYQNYITKGAVLYHKTSSSTVDMCAAKYTKKGKLVVPEKVGKYTVTGVKNVSSQILNVINYQHKKITEVNLADTITRLGDSVFDGAPFTKIKFPANLIRIEKEALFNNHLKEIKLPPKLKYIGENAFVRMYFVLNEATPPEGGLGDLPNNIVIPKSVKTIEDGNFGYYYVVYNVDNDLSWGYVKIDGYKVKGKKGSYAQKYAKEHGLKFVAVS